MVLIDLISTSRRRDRIGRFALRPTLQDVGTQPQNDISSDFFFETCNKEFTEFLGHLARQELLVAHLKQKDTSTLKSLDSLWMIGESSKRFSQLLRMDDKNEAGSKTAMAERSFLELSLSKLHPILHAILEGIFVHLHTSLWHSNVSLVSHWKMHARTDIVLGSQDIIWSTGLKTFVVKQRKDNFVVSSRWTDQTSDVGFDSCYFPVKKFRLQIENPTSQRTCTPSGKCPGVCDIHPFDSLCCFVQREPSVLLIHGKSGCGKTWKCEKCFLAIDKPRSGFRIPLRGKCCFVLAQCVRSWKECLVTRLF